MKHLFFVISVLGLAVVLIVGLVASSVAQVAPPRLIFYQGQLRNDTGTTLSGTYNLEFKIYDAVSGGNLIWGPEAHNSVVMTSGIFNRYLGSVNALSDTVFTVGTWLEIKVGSNTFSPRVQLVAVPAAFNAYRFDGNDSTFFAPRANPTFTGTVQIADGTQASGRVLVSDTNGRGQWTGNIGARVGRSTNQTIADSSFTAVAFTTEDFDNGNLHDNAVNNTRITIVESGIYIISANIELDSGVATGVGTVQLVILRNGVDTVAGSTTNGNGSYVATSISSIVALNAGDYIELLVKPYYTQSNPAIVSKPSYSPRFAATLVR